MHWFAIVIVIFFSIFMIIVRVVMRRKLTNDFRCISISKKIELIWIALRVIRNDWHEIEIENKIQVISSNSNSFLIRLKVRIWNILIKIVEKIFKSQNDYNSRFSLRNCEWNLLIEFIESRLSDDTSICDTKQNAKQNTNQNTNQNEKQNVNQNVNQDTNLKTNFIIDVISSIDVNANVLKFNNKLTNVIRYMRQFDELFLSKFVLNFKFVSNENFEI